MITQARSPNTTSAHCVKVTTGLGLIMQTRFQQMTIVAHARNHLKS